MFVKIAWMINDHCKVEILFDKILPHVQELFNSFFNDAKTGCITPPEPAFITRAEMPHPYSEERPDHKFSPKTVDNSAPKPGDFIPASNHSGMRKEQI